jgi:hypothetical protein
MKEALINSKVINEDQFKTATANAREKIGPGFSEVLERLMRGL